LRTAVPRDASRVRVYLQVSPSVALSG